MEPFHGMAALTPIHVRHRSKLSAMRVLVAIRTSGKLDLVDCCFPGWRMALCAFDCCMLAIQWIPGRRVFFKTKLRWFEPLHRMTARALATIGPLSELPSVRIWLMTIHTLRKSDWLLKVAVRMTLIAGHR